MRNSKNITILLILSIIISTNYSQSSSNFSQFFLQDYSYNSSLIGTDDNSLNVNLIHRQWGAVNYDYSPYSEYLGFQKSFGKETKIGLSGQYIRDFAGQAFTNNKFNIGVSGNQEIGNHYIGMGLSLNYSNQLFNPIEFENMESGDQVLLNGQQSFNMLVPAFGLNYKFHNSKNFMFQLGASSTNTTDLSNNISKSIKESISDEFNISLKTKFGSLSGSHVELQALYRGNGGFENYTGWTNKRNPRSIAGVFLMNNITDTKLSMGASFNGFFLENDRLQNLSISPIVLFPIKIFTIGVTYDYGLTNFQTYNSGIVELSVSYNPNIKRSQNSTTINEEDLEEDHIEEKPKKKIKKLSVSDLFIKTGDKKTDVKNVSIVNGSNNSFFKMSGSSWDHAIEGFRLKLKFLKKLPSSLSFDLIKVKISGNELIEVETLINNQEFLIDKFDPTGENNWIEIKLEGDRGKQRYLLRIYDSKKPESKVEFKFFKDWR